MNLHHFTTLNLFFYKMTKFLLKLRSFTIYFSIFCRYRNDSCSVCHCGNKSISSTIATLLLLVLQVSFLLTALSGVTDAISCTVSPFPVKDIHALVMPKTDLSPPCQSSPLQLSLSQIQYILLQNAPFLAWVIRDSLPVWRKAISCTRLLLLQCSPL